MNYAKSRSNRASILSRTVVLALLFGINLTEAAAMEQKQSGALNKAEVVGTDDIGTASTDDMFAFS